jgi:hypothetical protein
MRSIIFSVFILCFYGVIFGQKPLASSISSMKWGADFNIHITFDNDSSTIYDVRGLYHSTSPDMAAGSGQVTYYPVSLDPEFINALKNRNIESFTKDTTGESKQTEAKKATTLWSALHGEIGGGYIHFINCLVYSLESRNLSLESPILKRPEPRWKPNPVTESYNRTKKWKLYVPDNQKLAQKEYKIKEQKSQLGDIVLLPPSFIELFLNTNQKQYNKLITDKRLNKVAIIDMVRLLVGANYLGQEQIDFIRAAVSNSVMQYAVNSLPSVIIFDDFGAAVAMTLDREGYKIDKVVFNNQELLAPEEVNRRLLLMEGIIKEVNEVNKKVFEKNLKKYYQ